MLKVDIKEIGVEAGEGEVCRTIGMVSNCAFLLMSGLGINYVMKPPT